MELLKIKPIFKEMIWGGNRMRELYDFRIPSDHTGEAWVISARDNGEGIIENGQYSGQTLSSVYYEYGSLFGKKTTDKFPLLIKIIDARQNLSVQVHPDDEYAKINENSFGKEECWYVLDCPIDAEIIIGHSFESKEEFKKVVSKGLLESKLNKFPIKKGDFFYIPAGTIHAICANTLVYEVQQNSDITYRVFDYNRLDDNGKQRQLHISKALDAMQIPNSPIVIEQTTVTYPNIKITELINNEYFSIKKIECFGLCEYDVEDEFLIVGCIEGKTYINECHLNTGEHLIVPNPVRKLLISNHCTLIVSASNVGLLK